MVLISILASPYLPASRGLHPQSIPCVEKPWCRRAGCILRIPVWEGQVPWAGSRGNGDKK